MTQNWITNLSLLSAHRRSKLGSRRFDHVKIDHYFLLNPSLKIERDHSSTPTRFIILLSITTIEIGPVQELWEPCSPCQIYLFTCKTVPIRTSFQTTSTVTIAVWAESSNSTIYVPPAPIFPFHIMYHIHNSGPVIWFQYVNHWDFTRPFY